MTNFSLRTAVRVLWAISTISSTAFVQAQSDWRSTAVPFYTTGQFAQASTRDAGMRAANWKTTSERLVLDLQAYCRPVGKTTVAAGTVQSDWRASASAWDRLDALELGPLLARRSARAVDFMPTRPTLLARAIASQPRDAAAMELVGTPAKGFEALESLLWPEPAPAGSPRCDYAIAVAAYQARESVALAAAFDAAAATEPGPEQGDAAFSEAINQWLGGIETLRWVFMRKPVEVAATRNEATVFARARSAQTQDSWAARWQVLKSYAVLGARATPLRDGAEALISVETWLRSRGANALADKLVRVTGDADQAMAAADTGNAPSVLAAAAALERLTELVQRELAPALSVPLGFSDADGD